MQTKFDSLFINQSSIDSFISSQSTPIHVLPENLLLGIFQTLNLKDVLSARLVCRHWKKMASDFTTIYGQYLKEVNTIERLASLPVRFSAWMPMPRHWGLYTKENSLKFSSIKEDIIAFHPPFCNQSSNFFSFTSSIPFSNRYVFLGQYGNTYFLTPQGQTQLQLELSTDLQPFESHKLVAINIKDSARKREFSLLKNLPPSPENFSQCQIEYCFPITENNIVIITRGGKISFWNLLNEVPNCYKELEMDSWSEVYKIGKQLLFNKKIVDLDNPSFLDHGFKFKYERIKTFESSFCAHNENKKEIRYFIINNHGMLEKKWDFDVNTVLEFLDKTKGPILSLYVKDMNEKFILLACSQIQANNMIIMNTKGEIVQFISEELSDIELDHSSLYQYPTFAHLSDNVLIYKNPHEHAVSFWHIPTQKCIQKFDWTKSIYDFPLLLGNCLIQDVRLSNGKLIILLSTEHTPLSNKPAKFRLIQFDLQNTYREGLSGIFNCIYSFVKGVYYAFPGKKEY